MANIWFSADLHLSHHNIILGQSTWGFRDFKNTDHMNDTIIRNWNERVKPEDTGYLLGDCAFKGDKQGGKNKFNYWRSQLNGHIVIIQGNHDLSNGIKGLFSAYISFGGLLVLLTHNPYELDWDHMAKYPDLILSGHVHKEYKHSFLELYDKFFKFPLLEIDKFKIPIINVGMDVWDYKPVKLNEVLVYYDKIKKRSIRWDLRN